MSENEKRSKEEEQKRVMELKEEDMQYQFMIDNVYRPRGDTVSEIHAIEQRRKIADETSYRGRELDVHNSNDLREMIGDATYRKLNNILKKGNG